ncbi:MAG: tRNA (adenosine(37)-N6)-threonylcarbamoyltransferase complex dimerization subunit type 1 TsaB [Bacteroidetes bacterium]|nr:tRNA (adenosine(37)-N6)-threonylcarbamoyltransferase complex dimerization subunit type 1 TsaB [Bacteroidota bacterium]
MARIISIETSTEVCSVALHEQGQLVALSEIKRQGAHAEELMGLLEEVVLAGGITFSGIDALAVSQGPGSYTGLRIGVSTAKGLAYGLGKPLIGINTLEAIASSVEVEYGGSIVVALDARRMEIFTQTFDSRMAAKGPISALILDEGAFSGELMQGKVYFVGDAVEKIKEVVQHPYAVFVENYPHVLSAKWMGKLAYDKYRQKKFEDIAYFVPNYLKEFKALHSKKNPFSSL